MSSAFLFGLKLRAPLSFHCRLRNRVFKRWDQYYSQKVEYEFWSVLQSAAALMRRNSDGRYVLLADKCAVVASFDPADPTYNTPGKRYYNLVYSAGQDAYQALVNDTEFGSNGAAERNYMVGIVIGSPF